MNKDYETMKPWTIRLFLLRKLPLAFLAGLRLSDLKEESCTVSLRHRWINQNPFRSIYFAALLMAAELSTGIIVLREIRRTGRKISMLIVQMEASFLKKATGKIQFKCSGVNICRDAIQKSLNTKDGIEFTLTSAGMDAKGEEVAIVNFNWSVKVKND